jgi:phosphatidate cytidylyltransferase
MTDEPAPVPAPTPKKKRSAGRNLPAAIVVGGGLIAVVVVSLAYFQWGFILLAAVMLSLGSWEIYRALQRLDMNAAIVPILIGTFALITGTYASAKDLAWMGIPWHSTLLMFLGATVLASLVTRMPGGPEGFVKDAAASLFIISYVGLLGSFTALLLGGSNGAARMVTFLLCVVANDTGGYAVGVLFGKHPMAPKISPKKTWEGLAGSFAFSVATGTLMAVFVLHAAWWVGSLLGVAMVFFGTCGDLIESMIKRDVGIKDMSSILPGHGGIMDRLDSVLVAAPAAWLVLYLMVPGG